MKLAWLTDIHLNFVGSRKTMDFADHVASVSDACVITGDIAEATSVVQLLGLFRRQYGKPVYFVLGNHDFYGGSFASVTLDVRRNFGAAWLNEGMIFDIGDGAQLCGVDGWYDAQFGNPETSRVVMNDWFAIGELRGLLDWARIPKLRAMGQEAARWARDILNQTTASRVIFATHVPPFAESSVYDGKQSDGSWLPWFTCKAMGFVLTQWAEQNPDRELTVWCGHTHGRALFQPLPNLTVKTGFADYGLPCIELVEEL